MALAAHKYERQGLLAINPRALLDSFFFDDTSEPRGIIEQGDCAIVDVRGPLETHAHPWCDSYEGIAQRVAAACETSARAVILRFDSPGGDVSGCFDTALAVRAMCDSAGKQLHAYVEGECASAAYALASQCMSITISMTSLIGSIGVLSTRCDVSAMNAARGLRVAFVMSGARKGDGHPELPISEAEIANMQLIVDSMAEMFFDLVSRGRGLATAAIEQLQARTFYGQTAIAAGLADAVGSLTTVLASVASFDGGNMTVKTTAKAAKMTYEELREALAAAAEGDDPNAAAAKRALAAMEESASAPAAEGGDMPEEKPNEGEAAASAEGGDSMPEDKKDEPAASAAMRMALEAKRELAQYRAEAAKVKAEAERARLIASRPDLTEDVVSLLEKAPLELVREHIAKMPALDTTDASAANPRVVKAAKSAQGSPTNTSQLPPQEKAALDAQMGITAQTAQVRNTPHKLELGTFR